MIPFYKRTKDKSPSFLLVHALKHCVQRNDALDLGCGAGRDTRFLLQQGFRVTAVDLDAKKVEAINSGVAPVQEPGLPELIAPLPDLLGVGQDPVHCADRAVVDAFVKQGRIDFGRRLVHEARAVQLVEHGLSLTARQRPRGARPESPGWTTRAAAWQLP